MNRTQKHDYTHLTLEERKIIQAGIENNSSKASIARTIGKDATTVAKEIRKHRTLKPRDTYSRPVICAKLKTCTTKPCLFECNLYEEPKCNRRDKSPGACNKCDRTSKCHYDKFFYNAVKAHDAYRKELSESREGLNITPEERVFVGEIIAPLLNKGQSVHQILINHKEILPAERTLYSYIESGVFKDFGVDNFSLKEQVNRKRFKAKYKIRKEPVNYTDHTYKDFLNFRIKNPDAPVTEMDTLYNDVEGPYLQTFMFSNTNFMVGFLHKTKDNESMSGSLNDLQVRLGAEIFSKLFSLLLADRGPEFIKTEMFEIGPNGRSRLNIFYCDPMQASQKPHVENNHNYVRDIIPNGYPLNILNQDDINLMFSHINSAPRRSLADRTPFDIFSFFYGDDIPVLLGITKIPCDNVILKPQLIYSNK
jgi:IS30 family transposase